jgi:homoserine O-acetyltransferase
MKLFIKSHFLFIVLFWTSLTFAQSELQLVNIGDFTTTNGSIIKDCKVGYRTIGKLNPDKSNVLLWPSWFDGTSENIINNSIFPNIVDTSAFYIIVVDALADGISSSPSNTVDFPDISIRDMVNSQYSLLINHLNINHLYAVLGASMGGMQTFEWLVAYPDFMDKAISIIGTPKQSFYDIFVWQTQADLIIYAGLNQEDINFAMKRAYDVCYMNAYSPSYYVRKYTPDGVEAFRNRRYSHMMNSSDYLAQLNAMIQHDIYKSSHSNPDNIKNVIKADILIIVAQQDHLVNPASSIAFSKLLDCQLVELTGDCGHVALWCEIEQVKEATFSFLK